MRISLAVALSVAAVVMVVTAYTLRPEEASPAGPVMAELENLRVQLALLESQHVAMTERVAELERFMAEGGGDYVASAVANVESPDMAESVVPEPVKSSRKSPAKNLEKIEDAGLTVEEFGAMEERAYALYLSSLETEWVERRERYLASDREPGAAERLRAELGDDAYDRYLYAGGRANRVRLHKVLPGSAAEQAGLASGDVVLSYGDERVFSFDDLRRLSYQGELGESVIVEVKRPDGSVSQLLMQRGPMGLSGYRGWREAPDQ
jgi:membrane-associated protease RseP (regulator of RpoE activity)